MKSWLGPERYVKSGDHCSRQMQLVTLSYFLITLELWQTLFVIRIKVLHCFTREKATHHQSLLRLLIVTLELIPLCNMFIMSLCQRIQNILPFSSGQQLEFESTSLTRNFARNSFQLRKGVCEKKRGDLT